MTGYDPTMSEEILQHVLSLPSWRYCHREKTLRLCRVRQDKMLRELEKYREKTRNYATARNLLGIIRYSA